MASVDAVLGWRQLGGRGRWSGYLAPPAARGASARWSGAGARAQRAAPISTSRCRSCRPGAGRRRRHRRRRHSSPRAQLRAMPPGGAPRRPSRSAPKAARRSPRWLRVKARPPTRRAAGLAPRSRADNPDFTYATTSIRCSQIRAQWVRPLGGGIGRRHFRVLGRPHRRPAHRRFVQLQFVRPRRLRAVQSASPLPPLPASYRRGELGVNLVIR
jgi:hypothetical protein